MTDSTGREMVGRTAELAVARSALRGVAQGRGGVVVVQGPPGSGRTSLLSALVAEGASPGARVLWARASPPDRSVPFGVVRQLLEPWWRAAGDGERAAVLTGAARGAAALFDSGRGDPRDGAAEREMVHAAYWLSRDLASGAPLVVAVDDLHWADLPSQDLVRLLATAAHDLPLAVLVTALPEPYLTPSAALEEVYAAPGATAVPLAPLAAADVETLLTAAFGAPVGGRFAAACVAVSGGNPLLLTELLAELLRLGRTPWDESAAAVGELLPPRAVRQVRRWREWLPPAAITVTETLAVLGDRAEPGHVAALSGLPQADVDDAVRWLVSAELVTGTDRPGLVHGLFGRVVYTGLDTRSRTSLHARGAQLLAADGLPAERVAPHLAALPPAGDAARVRALLPAARDAMSAGRPADAVRWLRRALREPPRGRLRAEVLLALGVAERRARLVGAADRLVAAVDAAGGGVWAGAEATVELGVALAAEGRTEEAVAVLRAAASTRSASPGLRDVARVELVLLGEKPPEGPPEGPAPALHQAVQLLRSGASAERVALAVEGFLASRGTRLDPVDRDLESLAVAGWLLLAADRPERAGWVAAGLLERASGGGAVLAASGAQALQAAVALHAGRLAEARDLARAVRAGAASAEVAGPAHAWATAVLVESLVHAGRLAEADAALRTRSGFDPSAGLTTLGLLRVRGLLRVAQDRLEEAVADLAEVDRLAAAAGPGVAGAVAHRVPLATALYRLGRLTDARAVADAELSWARRFGAARPLGAALRAAGLLREGGSGLTMLHEAARLLAQSAAGLEHPEALVDLGAALRRAGRRNDARRRLRVGVELAESRGASALGRRALAELAATGGRLRSWTHRGGASLTPSERRVALLAAAGLRNDEIARQLYVTVKAVEWHLGHVYPKLGIRRRTELPAALDAAGITPDQAQPA
jgi:DNA-binding CsgD family transcriptional regulator